MTPRPETHSYKGRLNFGRIGRFGRLFTNSISTAFFAGPIHFWIFLASDVKKTRPKRPMRPTKREWLTG